MFEFLFKYPWTAFSKGSIVWLGFGPVRVLPLTILLGAAMLGWMLWRKRFGTGALARTAVVWALQTAFVALLLAIWFRRPPIFPR